MYGLSAPLLFWAIITEYGLSGQAAALPSVSLYGACCWLMYRLLDAQRYKN